MDDHEIQDRFDRLEKLFVERFDRIEEMLSAANADYLPMKRAAKLTSLSYSHIRRAVLSGELPASNVGTAAHPIYRIAQTDLQQWMANKKGGTTRVPPKSELKELIKRHLPGL